MTRLPQVTTLAAVRTEWGKVTTVRVFTWVAAVSLLVSAAVGAFYAWVVLQMGSEILVSPAEATVVTTTKGSLTTVAAGLLGVLCVSGDRRFGGLSMAVVLEPRRSRVLAAKALVAAAVAAAVGVVGLILNAAVALAVLGGAGLVSDPAAWAGLALGAVVVHAGWAVVGVAVATLVRAAPAAVMLVVAGPWLVQRTLSVLALAGWDGRLLEGAAGLAPAAVSARLQSPLELTSPVVVTGLETAQQSVLVAGAAFGTFVAVVLWGAARAFATADLLPD